VKSLAPKLTCANVVAKDAFTGDKVKESTLGKVPSAARADSAASADSAAHAASADTAAAASALSGESNTASNSDDEIAFGYSSDLGPKAIESGT
jgi:hypothetical protein